MEYWNIGFRLPHFEKSHDSCNYSGRNPLFGSAMILMRGWLSLTPNKNINGEIVKIHPENLDPNTKVMRF